MSVYLARLKGCKEIVGFFWADSYENLFWAIDECVNPDACEVKQLFGGGIFWPDSAPSTTEMAESEEDFGIPPTFSGSIDFADETGWMAVEDMIDEYM